VFNVDVKSLPILYKLVRISIFLLLSIAFIIRYDNKKNYCHCKQKKQLVLKLYQ